MTEKDLLAPWVRRFLLGHVVAERNLARNTRISYRDTLTLLLPFANARSRRPIDWLTVEDLSPAIVRQFLEYLERDRHCGGTTRNQRLSTIPSLARFIGNCSPPPPQRLVGISHNGPLPRPLMLFFLVL